MYNLGDGPQGGPFVSTALEGHQSICILMYIYIFIFIIKRMYGTHFWKKSPNKRAPRGYTVIIIR